MGLVFWVSGPGLGMSVWGCVGHFLIAFRVLRISYRFAFWDRSFELWRRLLCTCCFFLVLGGDTAVFAGGTKFASSALCVQGDAQHFVRSLLYVAEVGECLCQIKKVQL